MDIQRASMDNAQAKLADQVGTALLAKSLQGMRDQSAALAQLFESAAPLPAGSGGNVDLRA
jgi:hypothetical protein